MSVKKGMTGPAIRRMHCICAHEIKLVSINAGNFFLLNTSRLPSFAREEGWEVGEEREGGVGWRGGR